MTIFRLLKSALLGPARFALGPERYETLRYFGYRALCKDQGYTRSYYESIEASNSKVYNLLARALVEVFCPVSVADVGCGSGGIGLALERQGVEKIFPFDFSQASVDMAKERGLSHAQRLDLTQAVEIPAKSDLCICLEVAEHIPRKYEQHVASLLSRVAPALVFTAAPPGQGGHLHVNLREKQQWIKLFDAVGMQHDPIGRDRLLEIFGGQMIHDYSHNLMVFRRH